MGLRVSYSEGYYVPLPPRHPFPMGKFPALHRILLEDGLLQPDDVVAPREVEWADLALVHTPEYLTRLADGSLTRQEIRQMGLPWSEQLVRRSRLAVQGTLNAAMMALEDGIAANLAGGTHHAFPTHGSGFCVFNDVAVAIRVLQHSKWIRRAFVVDLDVHQGDATAAIFRGDDRVFTFSMHGEKNFPFRKEKSTIDIALPDGTGDDAYLSKLAQHLPSAIEQFRPDLIFFLAGIDVLEGDRFGRIALTPKGLHERESCVLGTTHRLGIPVTLLLSGGYAATPDETAQLHAIAHRVAARIYRR